VLLLGSGRPAYLPANVPLILRTVLMIAAVASRPHLEVSRQRGYRATLNFLLLLFFWVLAYALLLVQQPLTTWDTRSYLRVDALYAGQNFCLLAVLGVLIVRAQPPWKLIYWYLLGAATLYVLTSLAANLVFALQGYRPGWVDLVFTTAACWFAWIALQGRKLAAQLEQSVQPNTADSKYTSLLGMLSVAAIPIIGLWELFRTDEPNQTHQIRLFIVLVAVLFLGFVVFIQEYLVNRDLFSEAALAKDRFHLAAQAGKMYAYEWDVATDLVKHSAEHANGLGFIDPGKQLTRQQLLDRVHPDDRALFVNSVRELVPENPTTQICYRVVRPDGGEVCLERRARAFFDADGKMLRMAGMVADVTERKQAEEALRESEDKLRMLLDSTAEAIYGIDLEHRCTFCNPACLRTLGYERMDEVLGKNMHDLIHHRRTDGTLFPKEECRIHRVAQTGEGVHAEDEVLWRANGTSFPAEYWSYPQRRGQELVGAVVAFSDITQRKLAEKALANVSRKLIEAQEQERTRIGRELHDDIGQRLAMLAVELEQLRQSPPHSSELPGRIGELQKQTSEIAADIQSLSHELHSAKLQYLGIAAAMRGFCQEFGKQHKVEIDFQTHDLPIPLPPDISLCLFRVLQEALHNSAKHSGVRHFEVGLWGTSDEIHLTVKDSGAGFDREAAKASGGLGLISMEERLKLLKGMLSIDSQRKRGTTIHAGVPLSSGSDSMRAAG
jgi:PAS domain S-box-containing protein